MGDHNAIKRVSMSVVTVWSEGGCDLCSPVDRMASGIPENYRPDEMVLLFETRTARLKMCCYCAASLGKLLCESLEFIEGDPRFTHLLAEMARKAKT